MSWKTVALGDVCKVIAGQSPEGKYYNNDGVGLPFYQGKKDFGKVYVNPPTVWTSEVTKEAIKDDILMSVRAPVGPVNISRENICIGRGLAAIRSSEKIDKAYLFNFLLSIEKELIGSSGAVFNSINKGQIEKLEIPLPPLATQQKIVTKLDAIFAEIDKATVAAETNAKNAEVLFQSFLKETFNNSKKQSTKIKIENIANITSSKRIMKHEYVNEGIPFYRTKEVKELANKRAITTELFISKENYYAIKSRFGAPQKGEILITAIGTIGEIYVIDTDDEFYFKDGNVLWAKDLKEVEPEFLKYVLMSFVNELNELSLGAAYSALPIHKLKNYEVLIPNLEYQRIQIISIKNMEVYSNILTMEYIKKKSLYFSLKQSILKQAFNGELVKE